MTFEQYDFSIAGHWLSALINGDYSGLDDEEVSVFNEWYDSVFKDELETYWPDKKKKGFIVWEVSEGSEPSFKKDEVSGFMADCYDVVAHFPVPEVKSELDNEEGLSGEVVSQKL